MSDGTEYTAEQVRTTDCITYELVNYYDQSIRLKEDINKTFIDSKLLLTYSDGKVEAFDGQGKIVAISDRYGNEILFSRSYDGSVEIKDTRGKIVKLNYVDEGNIRKLVITRPDGKTIEYSYEKKKRGKYNYIWALFQKKDEMGLITSFKSEYTTTKKYSMCEITEITYPTGLKAVYTYEIGDTEDTAENFKRIKTKKYNDGTKDYLKETYTYSETNYTGYIPKSGVSGNYSYYTSVRDDKNIEITYLFNEDNLNTEIKKVDKSKGNKVLETITYEYKKFLSGLLYFPKPVMIKKSTSDMTTVEFYKYNNRGALTSYINPLAEGNKNNTNYKVMYTYDSRYSIPIEKMYKKDANTTVKEVNTLSSNGMNITTSAVYENNVLKQKTDYVYARDIITINQRNPVKQGLSTVYGYFL